MSPLPKKTPSGMRRKLALVAVQALCFCLAPQMGLPLLLLWPSWVRGVVNHRFHLATKAILLTISLVIAVVITPSMAVQAAAAVLWLAGIAAFDRDHLTTVKRWQVWTLGSLSLLAICVGLDQSGFPQLARGFGAVLAGDLASFLLHPNVNWQPTQGSSSKRAGQTRFETAAALLLAWLLPWTMVDHFHLPMLLFFALVAGVGLLPVRSVSYWGSSAGAFYGVFMVKLAHLVQVSPAEPPERIPFWGTLSLGFLGLHLFLTAAQKYKSVLEKSEQARTQLELALEASDDCAWEWNFEDEAEESGALDAEGVFRPRFSNWTHKLHEEDRERTLVALETHLAGETVYYESKHRLRSPDGSWRWVLERGRVVENDAQGHPMRMLGTQRDITLVHEAEEHRLRLESQIEQNQRLESLGLLAGGVAHDFNNLLAAVIANLDLALEESREDLYLQLSLEDARGASMRAAELCRHLLAYAGRRPIESEVLHLDALVTEMMHLLRASIPPQIEVTDDLHDATPRLAADGSQVRQVLMNLMLNAADAIGQKTHGAISLRTGRTYVDDAELAVPFVCKPAAGEYAFLEVADNGCGMSSDVLERLFDPFFTTKRSGRGLGMAAVIGIVRGHEGGISVESVKGEGTTFRVYWPIATDADEEESESTKMALQLEGRGRLALIVDDEAPFRRVLRRALQRRGFEVLTAENGFDGLHLLEENVHRMSILITDVMMPGPKGWDLLRIARQSGSDVPVLLMSGFDGAEEDGISLLDRLSKFISKPFAVSHFERIVEDLFEEYEAVREEQGPQKCVSSAEAGESESAAEENHEADERSAADEKSAAEEISGGTMINRS